MLPKIKVRLIPTRNVTGFTTVDLAKFPELRHYGDDADIKIVLIPPAELESVRTLFMSVGADVEVYEQASPIHV